MKPYQPFTGNSIIFLQGNTGVTSLRDCGGICNGTAVNSSCGICLQQGESDPFLDCNNECFGEAEVDSCSECTGGSTGKVANYLKDECGTFPWLRWTPFKVRYFQSVTILLLQLCALLNFWRYIWWMHHFVQVSVMVQTLHAPDATIFQTADYWMTHAACVAGTDQRAPKSWQLYH